MFLGKEYVMNRTLKKCIFLFAGVFIIGMGVACYRIAGFGTDPISSLVIGLNTLLGISFGTMQLMILTPMLAFMLFMGRDKIGIGTFVNMVLVGYSADLGYYLLSLLHVSDSMVIRILFFLIGLLLTATGVTMYMNADLGVAPYEGLAIILTRVGSGRLQFRYARIITDVSCVILGAVFCLLGHNPIWIAVGIGTIIHAFANGPLVQKFSEYIRIDSDKKD